MRNLIGIRDDLETALAANSYLGNLTIIQEDGNKRTETGNALQSDGACIVLMPVVNGEQIARIQGESITRATLLVHWLVQPKVNSERATPFTDEEAITNIRSAIEGITTDNTGDAYQFTGFELLTFDDGLIAYTVDFSKLVLMKTS